MRDVHGVPCTVPPCRYRFASKVVVAGRPPAKVNTEIQMSCLDISMSALFCDKHYLAHITPAIIFSIPRTERSSVQQYCDPT